MSSGQRVGHRARSSVSQTPRTSDRELLPSVVQPQHHPVPPFEPCAATASFFLYAQRNVILCLHHDTLAIERRFEQHKSDVLLISADNVSERGAGRLIVSYDTEQTAIVWDLLTGEEVARFASYEHIHVAAWMRDGSIAFGNAQGNIILFEPSSSEHVSARTIYDPVTALAPASDCTTFAIGYQNGSILIASLQPSFTILHTLTTSRGPSPIVGLAWHSSSSKQKTEMLATQMADGDLRIWSVSKTPHSDTPRIIRILKEADAPQTQQNWFAWSKNGRIIQHSEGDTRACDVRTKKVMSVSVPTIDHVVALASYGPSGTLFTIGRSHSVQQYDLVSQDLPVMVANVQHVPPNAPPTPPDSIEESKRARTVPMTVITSEQAVVHVAIDAESSEEDGNYMSPLQKIAQEREELDDEQRDCLAPLSPYSSRGSLSSASSTGRHKKPNLKSTGQGVTSGSTLFSGDFSQRSGQESPSIRSTSSTASSRYMRSALRHEVMRSPEETRDTKAMDLFPYIKTRLTEVKFKPPTYGQADLTPDVLRKEMLNVVFGWDGDIEDLIREEQTCHRPGSASGVLLSKWLGELGADTMAQMIGSESMTSSDWMLLALSCHMGQGSQKKVGQAFVKRLLETGEIHPAVAILLGLGEQDEAVEVYVSRRYYMEAVLLTCLISPNDWQRQSHLVRKWGELAVSQGQPELAVRCFSCTTIESSEPWFSPRAQDAIYQAQQQALAPHTLSPPASPPSATTSNRLAAKMGSLKLITKFGDQGLVEQARGTNIGITPIADTAITPGVHGMWRKDYTKDHRERSHSRTATPGGIGRRRLPSSSRNIESDSTPLAGSRAISRHVTPAPSEVEAPSTAIEVSKSDKYPARQSSRVRNMSKDRNHNGLQIDLITTIELADSQSPDLRPPTAGSSHSSLKKLDRDTAGQSQSGSELSQSNHLMTRNIDRYTDSLDAVTPFRQRQRTEESLTSPSRDARSRSRSKITETGESQRQLEPTYIRRSRRSPSSPIPMTADEAGKASRTETLKNDRYRPSASPSRAKAESNVEHSRSTRSTKRDYSEVRSGSPERLTRTQSASKHRQESKNRPRQISPGAPLVMGNEEVESRKTIPSAKRSPASPSAMDLDRSMIEQRSQIRDETVRALAYDADDNHNSSEYYQEIAQLASPVHSVNSEPFTDRRTPRAMSRKELAARELEERRLSLARRPSVPTIPHPAELSGERLRQTPRAGTDPGLLQRTQPFEDLLGIPRSHTVGPEVMTRNGPSVRFASPMSSTPIGLPATPKAMQRTGPASLGSTSFTPVVPASLHTLDPASYHDSPFTYTTPPSATLDDFGPLLPSSVFTPSKPPIVRSYSAPPINFPSGSPNLRKLLSVNKQTNDLQNRPSPRRDSNPGNRAHARKRSDFEVIAEVSTSFEAGLKDAEDNEQVIVVEDDEAQDSTPMLAELAHLAGPPPPPPPPTLFQPLSPSRTSGIIDIVIDDNNNSSSSQVSENHPTTPPTTSYLTGAPTYPPFSPVHPSAGTNATIHRRLSTRAGSIDLTSPVTPSAGSGAGGSGISSKWRTVTDRMRSSSRNRTKSPPSAQFELVSPFSATTTSPPPAPYETILTPSQMQHAQLARMSLSMSPPVGPESFLTVGEQQQQPPWSSAASPPPPVVLPPGYLRTPREIRANMPPGTLQAGVAGSAFAGSASPPPPQMQQSGNWGYMVRTERERDMEGGMI